MSLTAMPILSSSILPTPLCKKDGQWEQTITGGDSVNGTCHKGTIHG